MTDKERIAALESDLARLRQELATHRHNDSISQRLDGSQISYLPVALLQLVAYDYNSGTAGGLEDSIKDPQEGMTYARKNYGSSNNDDVRIYLNGAWRSVRMVPTGPEETITIGESVTVTVT